MILSPQRTSVMRGLLITARTVQAFFSCAQIVSTGYVRAE